MTLEHVFLCDSLSTTRVPRSSLLNTLDSLDIHLKILDGVKRNSTSKRGNAAIGKSFDSGMFDLGWIKPKPKKFSKSTFLWLIGCIVALVVVAFCCL